jgi:hypothetical protein
VPRGRRRQAMSGLQVDGAQTFGMKSSDRRSEASSASVRGLDRLDAARLFESEAVVVVRQGHYGPGMLPPVPNQCHIAPDPLPGEIDGSERHDEVEQE